MSPKDTNGPGRRPAAYQVIQIRRHQPPLTPCPDLPWSPRHPRDPIHLRQPLPISEVAMPHRYVDRPRHQPQLIRHSQISTKITHRSRQTILLLRLHSTPLVSADGATPNSLVAPN